MLFSLERGTRQHRAHHPRPIVRFTLIGPSFFVPQEPGVVITVFGLNPLDSSPSSPRLGPASYHLTWPGVIVGLPGRSRCAGWAG